MRRRRARRATRGFVEAGASPLATRQRMADQSAFITAVTAGLTDVAAGCVLSDAAATRRIEARFAERKP